MDDENQPLEQEQKTKRVNNGRHGKYKSCVYNLSFCVGTYVNLTILLLLLKLKEKK